ncbi:UPAR/Ly6 domain-containing protein bou [Planococcus citri]|uniref:UPAR/Ly6 domain-containing protein bou n=1 Tax=Planococcus citri TaxID=170843 RepID=UPI0031F9872E
MSVALLSIVLLSMIYESSAVINCYQCVSTDLHNPFQCNEYMEDSDLRPTPCDSVYNAAYCIKQTGRFEGGLGTKRYCSSLDLGNYCNYIKQPGDDLEYRSCVYTCDTDGCNNSNALMASSSCIMLTLAYYILL